MTYLADGVEGAEDDVVEVAVGQQKLHVLHQALLEHRPDLVRVGIAHLTDGDWHKRKGRRQSRVSGREGGARPEAHLSQSGAGEGRVCMYEYVLASRRRARALMRSAPSFNT
jgi:hypothetical protein